MPRLENKRIDLAEAKRSSEFFDGKNDIAKLGAGDSFYIASFLKKERKELFDKIMEEAQFTQMFNIGKDSADPIPRLVSAQSDRIDPQTNAIYRMPGCNEKNIQTHDWTPSVKYVCDRASEEINQRLNHCVLTLFRDKDDSLSFHMDKLVDLKDGSLILSISFGETRPILFYSLDGKQRQTVMLRPGSLLAIGPKTNKQFMHAIPKLTEDVGPRVSLSLRTVESFIQYESPSETQSPEEPHEEGTCLSQSFKILGKGSEFQTANYPFTVSHDDASSYSETVVAQIQKHNKAKA